MDGWEQLAALQAVYDGYLEEYRQRLIDNGRSTGYTNFCWATPPPATAKRTTPFSRPFSRP